MSTDEVAGVTAAALQRVHDGEHARVWERVRERLSEPVMAPRPGLSPSEHRDRVAEQMRALAGDPLVADGFPEHLGGGTGDVASYVTGFHGMAYGDLSLLVKTGVQYGLFGGAIQHLGTARHHERLRDVIAFRLPGCFAMSEVGHGSDVAAVRTTATHDRETDELVVHTPDPAAAKNWIGNAARDGRAAVVFCQLLTRGPDDDEPVERGVHAVLVPLRDEAGELLPGVTAVGDGLKMGLNGVDNGLLMFDHVHVPRTELLDRFAQVEPDGTYRSEIESDQKRFFTMLGTLVQGRVSIAGAAVGVAKVALTVAVRHGLTRRQFSSPDSGEEVLLLDYTAHQRRLMPLVATTWALHAAHARLVTDLAGVMGDDDAEDAARRELESRAAAMKAAASWHCTETVQQARESCGGAGYLAAYRLPTLKADSDIFTTFEGDNTVLLQLVAKNLLVGFRGDLESMNIVEMGRMVTEQAVDQVLNRTGVRALLQRLADVVPGTDDDDLADTDTQLSLLAWREEHLLMSVAQRIRAGVGEGRSPHEVFGAVQDHVLLVARAYVDRLVHEAARDLVEAAPDDGTREVLRTLVALHGARVLERERGWLLERGRISAARAKSLQPLVTRLAGELRPHASALVEAFGVPEAMLVDPAVVARHVTGQGPLGPRSVPAVPVERKDARDVEVADEPAGAAAA